MRALKNISNSWNSVVTNNTKITFNEYPLIVEKYKSGLTLQAIGTEYGVSRERIRQILSLYDLSRFDGGISTKAIINCHEKSELKKNKKEKQERKCFEMYGCNLEFFKLIRGDGDYKSSPLMRFRNQKHCATYRGIDWNLTLPQWWDIWQKSGHWNDRGLGSGKYVMARLCDIGPYSVDNVEIITHNENSREARDMDKVYNRSHVKIKPKYILNGNEFTLEDLSKKFNIKINTLYARISKGISVIDACTNPVKKWGR